MCMKAPVYQRWVIEHCHMMKCWDDRLCVWRHLCISAGWWNIVIWWSVETTMCMKAPMYQRWVMEHCHMMKCWEDYVYEGTCVSALGDVTLSYDEVLSPVVALTPGTPWCCCWRWWLSVLCWHTAVLVAAPCWESPFGIWDTLHRTSTVSLHMTPVHESFPLHYSYQKQHDYICRLELQNKAEWSKSRGSAGRKFPSGVHGSGGTSTVKEPGHFKVRKSSNQVTRMHFFLKKVDDLFLVVALKHRPPKPFHRQNKTNKVVRYSNILIFCSHYYRSKAIRRAWARVVDLPARSFDLVYHHHWSRGGGPVEVAVSCFSFSRSKIPRSRRILCISEVDFTVK